MGQVNNPVVPEFQAQNKNTERETIDFPSQVQASATTFTPVNIEEMPIKLPKPQLEETNISPEAFDNFATTTQNSIEVPKYNFEEMLEKALEAQEENEVQKSIDSPKVEKKKKPKFLKRK